PPPSSFAAPHSWQGEDAADQIVRRYPEKHRSAERVGRFQMNAAGFCPLLTAEKFCGFQQALGAEKLPRTCASYPRNLGVHRDGRRELAGFLSCPEVARLALLAEDGLERVPIDLPADPPINLGQAIDRSGAYFESFESIRPRLVALAAARPMSERLWILARFSAASVARFNRAAASADPVLELLTQFEDAGYQDTIVGALRPVPPEGFVDVWLSQVTALGEDVGRYPRPRRQIAAAMSGLDRDAYLQRRATRWPEIGAALTGPLKRYVEHHLLTKWFTEAPDLSAHIERLLIKVALVRTLLLARQDAGALDAAFIEVVYGVDRLVEHDVWIFQCKAALQGLQLSFFDLLGGLIRC
ncbi:MAG: hypothetical protein AAFV53_29315, partial [Myxococcota bacterium]